jgi:glycine C-acetyltransferase
MQKHSKNDFISHLKQNIRELKDASLYKKEAVITSPQGAVIATDAGNNIINFCANNYLGLSNNNAIKSAATDAINEYGYGMSSVRFICGTQLPHKNLENAISSFLQMEDTILYPSCFDANGGLFETILGPEDAVISDQLNHASIIDGIRLSKAKRYRYKHSDMADLETQLTAARQGGARFILIVTDGVFSMDGSIANLPAICDLAAKYQALTMIDDCHATGFMGKSGKGTHEHHNVMGKIDIITSTLGKALGGAMGGFTSAKAEIIEVLRQKSRPYLFSNTIPPSIACATLEALNIVNNNPEIIAKLHENTKFFREQMLANNFDIKPGTHPIVPVMFYDAKVAYEISAELMKANIYAVAFSFPVVPKGEARIRIQISASHTKTQLEQAIAAFCKARDTVKKITKDNYESTS